MEQQKYPGATALLEKFHAGKCTPEELALLDEWYDGLGGPAPAGMPAREATARRDAFLEHFRNNVATPKVVPLFPRVARRMLAASVLLLVGLALAWLYARRSPQAGRDSATLLVENGSGAIKKVTLPDSTEVWLNANASLRWNEDPVKKERHLHLTGEGYFDVATDAEQPFFLHTRDLSVRVLGTAFSVEAYPAEKMSRISLVNGKVQVCANADTAATAVLEPGFAATYGSEHAALLVARADINLATAWKQGGFAVSRLPLRDAMARLCNRYGYTVRWANDKHVQKLITVALPARPFEEMLGNLCYMNHKRFSISGKLITIY